MRDKPISLNYGMDLDSLTPYVKAGFVTYALNANIQSSSSTQFSYTNEPGNILCSTFKVGFNVIGFKFIIEENRTLFFLVNPSTNESEIGEIKDISFEDQELFVEDINKVYDCIDCKGLINASYPVLHLKNIEKCSYKTIISASCLNFKIDNPIDIEYKVLECGTTIYFSDNLNGRRYINLADLPYETFKINCEVIKGDNIDCNKMELQPNFSVPCISYQDVLETGSLESGVYQFAIQYSNSLGEDLSKYYSITNPISIKDTTRIDDLGQETSKSIKIIITGLETEVYDYYNLVVIKTVRNVTSVERVGTFPTNVTEYTYTGNNKIQLRIPVQELFKDFPYYFTSDGIAKSNGQLMWYGLKSTPQYNFQKAVSRFQLNWITYKLKTDYSNPLNQAFRGYQRDEVVPFGIVFQLKNGDETDTFPLVGPEITPYDKEIIPFTNQDNLNPGIDCDTPAADKPRWQVYNTGSVLETYLNTEGCDAVPYQKGKFAYWQSTVPYPNNKEVWGDLCGQPIRHFKFPDCSVTHIHSSKTDYNQISDIFPIGVTLDENSVNQGLAELTQQERDLIVGYKIVRGNRVNNKSVIAKGLIYNVGRYDSFDQDNQKKETHYFPNYPFNDLRKDPFLYKDSTIYNDTDPQEPEENWLDGFSSQESFERYTFHSPDTHFYNPGLGNVLKLETEEFGKAKSTITEVENHSKYKFLTLYDRYLAYIVAGTAVGVYVVSAGLNGNIVPIAIDVWEATTKIILNAIPYRNFCYQQNSVGHYNNYNNVFNNGYKQRLLGIAQYIDSKGFYNTGDIHTINNFHRESSVYFKTIGALPATSVADLSRYKLSDISCKTDITTFTQVSSYYASLKRLVPDQYGSIGNIDWIDTGSCGTIVGGRIYNPSHIFGGDTFINRFALKRKLRYFNDDRVGFPNDADIDYEYTRNVSNPIHYFNTSPPTLTNAFNASTSGSGAGAIGSFFSNMKDFFSTVLKITKNNFDCNQVNLVQQIGKIYLYNYGIPYFYVESDENVDLRYYQNDTNLDFYPHSGSPLEIPNSWLQEKKVSVALDNTYLYNKDYSKQNKENSFTTLPDNYNSDLCRTTYPNRIIWSSQSNQEELKDNWLVYKALDYYDFPKEYGRLVNVKGIENNKVIAIFENTFVIYNAYNTIQTDTKTALISNGGMFAQPPQEFSKGELGYGGTQHKAFISNQFGQFWVDCVKGCVFNLSQGLKELSSEEHKCSRFLKENLPFKITKYFPEVDTDNNFKGIGISMGWDYKFNRLFLTKLDYIPTSTNVAYNTTTKIFYDKTTNNQVQLSDEKYFCSKCWTIAYSPITGSWLSFYSFKPNYYIAYANYFKTGSKDLGLWSHLLSNKIYQTFYGEIKPYILEYPTSTGLQETILQSIEYSQQIREYFGESDFYSVTNLNFNKCYIYNDNQTSGILNLILAPKNNLSIFSTYPKYNSDSKDILYSVYENKYSFNTFWDVSKNITNGHQPIHTRDCSMDYDKILNENNLDYSSKSNIKNRLRGTDFKIRLIQDTYNRFQFINYWNLSEKQLSN